MSNKLKLYRSSILHFESASLDPASDAVYFDDGALLVDQERIVAIGNYNDIASKYPHCSSIDYSDRLIIPGIIDSHLHYPQSEMLARYGTQLLDWLEKYTFPTEDKFSDLEYCNVTSAFFLNQLIKNGTTTAFTYASVHRQSVDSLFAAASALNMSIITGKVCMDRNCPDYLQDTAINAQKDSAELIDNWHENGRNFYALTPRFAPTSSESQLAALGELAQQYPSVFVQTHLSENHGEINWVKELYPVHKTYLDVYDAYHMVRPRALFGHCLHLHDEEWARLSEADATAVFCPTSNLFLGSGLFSVNKAKQYGVQVALATDVGAGTTFNMLKTFGEAYKISQLQETSLNALDGLYMMTQGPASYYGLDDQIGNLNPGSYADFVVINPYFDDLSSVRCRATVGQKDPQDLLFALSFIGDDRAIEATYIAGKNVKKMFKEQAHAMV